MDLFQGNIHSKLPQTGTSIFAVMTGLAKEHNAVNLSQGFPDFPISEELIDRVSYYMKAGFNQYAPMPGVAELRNAISQMFRKNHDAYYNPDTEITVTAGGTQALYAAIAAFIKKDDEVIIFEPAYDSYAPAVQLNGGIVKYAQLEFPDFRINWDELPRMFTHRTKMVIINTPHNPTGSVLHEGDLKRLERMLEGRDIVVLSDEVYEHLIFEDIQHQSVCRFPNLARRSLLVGSFGKTFHATGWKTGFVLAPENLMREFRKAHQFVVFASNTPVQYAISDYITNPANYQYLGKFYQKKRDLFVGKVKTSRFKVLPCYGTYFQLLGYDAISGENEMDFAVQLVKEHGIAAVPVSPFYHDKSDHKVLRFCFAKQQETIEKAGEILCRI
ncbi:MAG: aminotransferase class I/II-fold pyridoxal phosphate-dependent enzyme [Bacteroidetes bacterium]|nr:aminotransferase class I/II-fold pyridoxal phosphate-dependent enzyme [Bacteroidota bacterium]